MLKLEEALTYEKFTGRLRKSERQANRRDNRIYSATNSGKSRGGGEMKDKETISEHIFEASQGIIAARELSDFFHTYFAEGSAEGKERFIASIALNTITVIAAYANQQLDKLETLLEEE